MTKILKNTQSLDTWPLDEATPLYTLADLKKAAAGDLDLAKVAPTAWQMGDLSLHDADDVEEETAFRVWGTEYGDIDDANEALRNSFWDMTREFLGASGVESYKADPIMAREAFNDWTDSLCKGDEICDDTYDQCSLDD